MMKLTQSKTNTLTWGKWGRDVCLQTTELYYDEIDSPIGSIVIVCLNEKVIRIEYGTMRDLENKLIIWLMKFFEKPIIIQNSKKCLHVAIELNEYFLKDRKQFSIDFELFGTPFQQSVWEALYQTAPYGQTRSYQDLAIAIDHPKAVRAIGGAMNKNPISIVIPCHRIIGKSGKLVGYGGGLNKKQFLLNHEGSLMI